METSIRRIRPDDAAQLRRMRIAALTDAPDAFGSTLERELAFGDEEWDERATGSAAGSERVTFFAQFDGDVVGIAGGFRDGATVDLVSMWTAPPARGLGIGRVLVERVIDWARSTGAERVELWVTRGNDAARRLYESTGFAATGDHQPLPSDPCADEIRMRRTL